jgi:hypothetical protein
VGYRLNSELVTKAWLLSLPGMPAGKVATSLPAVEDWATTGFVRVTAVVGGDHHPSLPVRRPVVQLDFFAARLGSKVYPPWGQAFDLAELVVAAQEVDSPDRAKDVTLPEHDTATVQDVSLMTEPRRGPIPDPASYARVTMDIQIQWTSVHTS